jgi:hypothetical protein
MIHASLSPRWEAIYALKDDAAQGGSPRHKRTEVPAPTRNESRPGGTSLDLGKGAVSERVRDRIELGCLETCPVPVLHVGRRVQRWDRDLARGIRETRGLEGRQTGELSLAVRSHRSN